MSERISVLLSEEVVDKRIKDIGEQITKDYEGKQIHLICVNWQRELKFLFLWTLWQFLAMVQTPNPAVLSRL